MEPIYCKWCNKKPIVFYYKGYQVECPSCGNIFPKYPQEVEENAIKKWDDENL